jgi:hypothetical protein
VFLFGFEAVVDRQSPQVFPTFLGFTSACLAAEGLQVVQRGGYLSRRGHLGAAVHVLCVGLKVVLRLDYLG